MTSTIRKPRISVNPTRAFAPATLYRDIKARSFNQVVAAFGNRIKTWYIDQALKATRAHEGFLLTTMSCIVLDLLSQYFYNLPNSQAAKYRQFLREQIPEFNQPIQPPIHSYTYTLQGWRKEAILSLDHAFWHGFRCGIIHNGMILEYGRISGDPIAPKIVQIRDREDSKGKEVAVNPRLLIDRVDRVSRNYVRRLTQRSERKLRNNFSAKFMRDFGLKLTP